MGVTLTGVNREKSAIQEFKLAPVKLSGSATGDIVMEAFSSESMKAAG